MVHKFNTIFQDTLQNEYTRIIRAENAIAIIIGKKVHKAKCVSMGSTSIICEEEIWNTQAMY